MCIRDRDWPALCAVLAREYHWSPAQIRELTYQEFVHYLNAVGERREKVQSEDVTLEYTADSYTHLKLPTIYSV